MTIGSAELALLFQLGETQVSASPDLRSYSCALTKNGLASQGAIYVFRSYIGFYSKSFGREEKVAIAVDFEKSMVDDRAITVVLKNGETHRFVSFRTRDQAYHDLCSCQTIACQSTITTPSSSSSSSSAPLVKKFPTGLGALFILIAAVCFAVYQRNPDRTGSSNIEAITLSTGALMPGIGLGTWKADAGRVADAVQSALAVGYRHIDCAYIYGNEKEVGTGLQAGMAALGLKREDVFITTKLWNTFHESAEVEPALDAQLQDLGLEYVDLYLMHWPVALRKGAMSRQLNPEDFLDVPVEETWKAMEKLVTAGKAKAIGVSNFGVARLQKLLENSDIKPSVNQIEVHPYLPNREVVEFCQSNDIQVQAYCPLGSPGNAAQWQNVSLLVEHPTITAISSARNKTPAQVLLKWLVQRSIVPLPKSTTESHIRENYQLHDWSLSDADIAEISSIHKSLDVPIRFINVGRFLRDGETDESFWS